MGSVKAFLLMALLTGLVGLVLYSLDAHLHYRNLVWASVFLAQNLSMVRHSAFASHYNSHITLKIHSRSNSETELTFKLYNSSLVNFTNILSFRH